MKEQSRNSISGKEAKIEARKICSKPALVCFSVALVNVMIKKKIGKQRFLSSYTSRSQSFLNELRHISSRQEPKGKKHEGKLQTDVFPGLYLAGFLRQLRPNLQRSLTVYCELALLISVRNQN